MKIKIQNKIKMADHQYEKVDQEHEAEIYEKGGYHYLIHQNEEDEKVVIKLNESELLMTRFSTPKSTMRFTNEGDGFAHAAIPTPMGVQRILIHTKKFELDRENSTIHIHYDLKPHEEGEALASYRLKISWEE